ncbi:spbB protein [Bacillus cereus]|nr:spbB protein [Bacillus cereus]MEB8666742.1 spbB protein [Bacillus cereus]
MLGMLFTATVSNDVVKDLQDKVISLQDHEVAFLNTTISNILTSVGIGVAIITTVFTAAFAYVTYSNKRAKKNMDEASRKLEEAENKVSELEEKSARLERKIVEAEKLLVDANSISNIANEKLQEVEEEQKKLKEETTRLNTSAQFDLALDRHKAEIERIKANLSSLTKFNYPFFLERRLELSTECFNLETEFHRIKTLLTKEMLLGGTVAKYAKEVTKFSSDVGELGEGYRALEEEMTILPVKNDEKE